MNFLTIGALAIALFVAAPIAAHLLRRRKAEERPFPPAHLVPATPPTARRRSMLEDRALFGVRALAVLLLALLGATPFVRCSRLSLARKDGASVALAIVLDDSLSMRAPFEGKTSRFERALEAARELSSGLSSGDAVALVLAGSPARVALGSTTNVSALDAALASASPSDRATDLDGALDLAKSLLRGLSQRDKRIVLLSDLADGSSSKTPLSGEEDISLWVPLPELTAKGEDCAVTRADRSGTKLWARVVCTATMPQKASAGASASASAEAKPDTRSASADRELLIRAGDQVIAKTRLSATIRAEEVAVELPADAPEGLRAALSPGDSIVEDDEAPVIAAGGALPMAVVVDTAATHVETGGPPPIEQAFAALDLDAQVRPLPSVPEHEAELDKLTALIVDDAPGFTPEVRRALAAWVERGGVALLTLGPRAASAPLGAGFEPLIPGVVRWGSSPAAGVDPASASNLGAAAPSLAKLDPRGRASLDASASEDAEILAKWSDGAPFLLRRSIGRGAVVVLTLPLATSESDLALRPAFLSLLDRFVSTARARGGARRIDVGEAWTFDGYREVKIARAPRTKGEEPLAIAATESDGRLRASPPLAGLYELELDGTRATRVAAIPDREIDLSPRAVNEEVRAPSLGGVSSSLDASPYVALALLALFATELGLRLWGQRRDEQP